MGSIVPCQQVRSGRGSDGRKTTEMEKRTQNEKTPCGTSNLQTTKELRAIPHQG